MREQHRVHTAFNDSLVGSVQKVICEGYDKVAESYFGRTYADSPEIDGKVFFSAPKRLEEGQFVNVRITEVFDYDLLGKAEI